MTATWITWWISSNIAVCKQSTLQFKNCFRTTLLNVIEIVKISLLEVGCGVWGISRDTPHKRAVLDYHKTWKYLNADKLDVALKTRGLISKENLQRHKNLPQKSFCRTGQGNGDNLYFVFTSANKDGCRNICLKRYGSTLLVNGVVSHNQKLGSRLKCSD